MLAWNTCCVTAVRLLVYGMCAGRVHDHIVRIFDSLPGQLEVATRELLDHPDDVALLSMRELARRADVPPATMTRLTGFRWV